MGIINITPDSFSRDGCMGPSGDFTPKAIRRAERLILEGADIIDIGGESTRPGADRIPAAEEIRRIIPTIRYLAQKGRVPVSVDTYKSTTARHALDAGASVVNNINGVRAPKSFWKMVQRYGAAVILMHIRGTPKTMQRGISYRNVLKDIMASLRNSIEICLESGIKSDKIIIDPGFGFGKTAEQNLLILNRLRGIHFLHYPVLIGTSRKSFIGSVLDKDVGHRLMGTAATVTTGILNGAHMVRVHDVAAITETVRMTDAILNEETIKKD